MQDLVIGIDASTTAVKAIAFDARGHAVMEVREPYPTARPAPDQFEQDAEDWWRALTASLGTLTTALGSQRFAGLCIAHQRESFVLVDRQGLPVRPAILWIDERSRAEVQRLSASIGRATIHAITGKPPDPTPALYGLAWLATHEPTVLARAHAVLDVQGFLVQRLTGRYATSTASADPLGLLDTRSGLWCEPLVRAAGLSLAHCPELVAPGARIGTLTAQAARDTGLPVGFPVIAGGGDGQFAGLGAGALAPGRAYLSIGSGVVSGMHDAVYRTDDAYRTLTGPTGHGFMYETVQRTGTQLIDWTTRLVTGRDSVDSAAIAGLEVAASRIPAGSDGLMVLPYWAGVMNPYWDDAARGAMLGVTLSHGPAHLFRATLEGLALEQGVATAALERSLGRRAETFVVAGGGARSGLLLSIMAAVLNRPLTVSPVPEAVALGAAMLASIDAGWHATPAAAMAAMIAAAAPPVVPDPALVAAYAPRLALYADIFPALQPLFKRLADLAPGAVCDQ